MERRTARESREQIYTSAPRRLEKTVRADQSVPLLAGGVPNLGLDDLAVDLEAAGGELDADGGLGLEAELVLGEAGEEVGLADAGVADEHHLEEVVVVVLGRYPPPLAAIAPLRAEKAGCCWRGRGVGGFGSGSRWSRGGGAVSLGLGGAVPVRRQSSS